MRLPSATLVVLLCSCAAINRESPVATSSADAKPTVGALRTRLLREDPRFPLWNAVINGPNREWLEALELDVRLPPDAACRFKSVASPFVSMHIAGIANFNSERWLNETVGIGELEAWCESVDDGARADCRNTDRPTEAWRIVCVPEVDKEAFVAAEVEQISQRYRMAMQAASAHCGAWRKLVALCERSDAVTDKDLDLVDVSLRVEAELFDSGGYGFVRFGGIDSDPELTAYRALRLVCELAGGNVDACLSSRPKP